MPHISGFKAVSHISTHKAVPHISEYQAVPQQCVETGGVLPVRGGGDTPHQVGGGAGPVHLLPWQVAAKFLSMMFIIYPLLQPNAPCIPLV